MNCQTCKGAGHVPGHWTAELCPACSGSNEIPLAEVPDKNMPGCFLVSAVFAGSCFLVFCDWVWSRWVV